jgi:hypothetical protein
MYWGILIFLAVTFVILYFLKRYGILDTPVIEYKSLPSQNFLYVEHVGGYKKIGNIFTNMQKILFPKLKDTSKTAGFFYDNPGLIADQNDCRSVCGVFIHDDDIRAAEEFTRENLVYKLVRLPEIDVISSTYPIRGALTFGIIPLIVYPALHKFVETNGLNGSFHGGIEIYHRTTEGETIEYIYPYGEGSQNYKLTTIRDPKYKSSAYHKKTE